MYKINAETFVRAVRIIGRIDGIFVGLDLAGKEEAPTKAGPMGAAALRGGKKYNDELIGLLNSLNLPVTLAAAKRPSVRLEDQENPIKWEDVLAFYEGIGSRMADELAATKVFCLDAGVSKYFESVEPLFGQEVADKLPFSIPDIEDAGKCLALRQGTAAVFHLMRVMEDALKGLAKLLGIPYAPSWESYIKQITDKVSQQHKHKGIKWKRDEPFFKEILGDLQAIKIAWRNPTMHIVRRYSEEEAEDIFRAVRNFTKRLAPRLKVPKV